MHEPRDINHDPSGLKHEQKHKPWDPDTRHVVKKSDVA